jgi:alanine dehydrogenase
VRAAVETDPALALGVNTLRGAVPNAAVAEALNREPVPLSQLW